MHKKNNHNLYDSFVFEEQVTAVMNYHYRFHGQLTVINWYDCQPISGNLGAGNLCGMGGDVTAVEIDV